MLFPRGAAMLVAPEGSNMISHDFNSLKFYDVGGELYLVSMLFNVWFLTRRVIVRTWSRAAMLVFCEFFLEVKLAVLSFCSLELLLGKEDEFCFGNVSWKRTLTVGVNFVILTQENSWMVWLILETKPFENNKVVASLASTTVVLNKIRTRSFDNGVW